MFRRGENVIRTADLPVGLAAVLCGHVHRHQILRQDLAGNPLPAPVIFSGSTERTSFAEKNETKGYVMLTVEQGKPMGIEFRPLAVRPMIDIVLQEPEEADLPRRIRLRLAALDPNAVVRLRLPDLSLISAAELRRLAPATMTVSMAPLPRKRSTGA